MFSMVLSVQPKSDLHSGSSTQMKLLKEILELELVFYIYIPTANYSLQSHVLTQIETHHNQLL